MTDDQQADYSQCNGQKFEECMEQAITDAGLAQILAMPDVLSIVYEELNNEALKIFEERYPELVFPPIRVWARSYHPFTMGGDCNAPIYIKVTEYQRVDLGKGFVGYLVTSPSGYDVIVDAVSGGIVGSDLYEVRDDVSACDDIDLMKRQTEKQREIGLTANLVEEEEFWKLWEASIE